MERKGFSSHPIRSSLNTHCFFTPKRKRKRRSITTGALRSCRSRTKWHNIPCKGRRDTTDHHDDGSYRGTGSSGGYDGIIWSSRLQLPSLTHIWAPHHHLSPWMTLSLLYPLISAHQRSSSLVPLDHQRQQSLHKTWFSSAPKQYPFLFLPVYCVFSWCMSIHH